MVVEVWGFDGYDFDDVMDGVDYQGCQCFVFDFFGDDQQWFVGFGDVFQYWQQVMDVGDFFVVQQDEWVIQVSGL